MPGRARLPAKERVELVLVAVTLAAAGRLGAVHHRLEPAGHVHLQHLVASDEAVLLDGTMEETRGRGGLAPSGREEEVRLGRGAVLPAVGGILAFFCDPL